MEVFDIVSEIKRGARPMYVSKGVSEASVSFGTIVHRVAVRVGSKTALGQRIGQNKEVIKTITSGKAHVHERTLLENLVEAVQDDVHPEVFAQLRQLVKEIKPD